MGSLRDTTMVGGVGIACEPFESISAEVTYEYEILCSRLQRVPLPCSTQKPRLEQ